jgi:hypothetical protein
MLGCTNHFAGEGPPLDNADASTLVEKRLLVAHQFELCVAHMVCATIATPLVQIYPWRISICATHSLPFSDAYAICAIRILCVAHIAICTTNAKCATSHKKYVPLIFRTGPKKLIFSGIYTQQYTTIYIGIQYNCRIHSMQYKTIYHHHHKQLEPL